MVQKSFDEIVQFARTGLNPRKNFQLGNGSNKYITIKNIHNNTLVVDENTDVVDDDAIKLIHKRSQIKKGDILFCSIGRMGDMYIIEDDPVGWDINESVFAFTLDTNIIRQKYFYYIFKNQNTLDYLGKNSSGSTFKSIKMNQLKKMAFNLPSLEEQDLIVGALDKVSSIIEARNNELGALDELIKARFVEMFGDPETNPMGWNQVTVNDVCSSIVRGPFGSALKKEFFVEPDETTYKVYEQKHAIQKDATIGTYYVTKEKYNELKRFECVPGDILMSCSGTMGELYRLPEECERGIINQALCKFTLNEKILPICFLTYMRQTIGNLETKGSGIKNIAAVSYVKAMPINLPPIEVQEKFAAFTEQVDKSKVAIQKSLDEIQLLFDSLMQKYFG